MRMAPSTPACPPLGQVVRIGSDGDYEVVGTVEGLQEGDVGMLGLAAHPDGSIYATVVSTNPDANGVWRIDVDTAAAKRVPGTQQIGLPNGIAFAADGTMYVTDSIAGAVWRVPPDGTATQWVQAALLEGDESIGFGIPIGANGIALDEASGTVYVPCWSRAPSSRSRSRMMAQRASQWSIPHSPMPRDPSWSMASR